MSYNNGKIEAPVSFADVNTVIGSSHTDLGNLCKDTNINKWSRYKPQRSTTKSFLTYQERYNSSFGMNIPRLGTNDSTFRNLALQLLQYRDGTGAEVAHWEYLKPRGSSNTEYYRLHDFCRNPNERSQASSYSTGDPTNVNDKGYCHDAQCPIGIFLLERSGVEFLHEYVYEIKQLVTGKVTIYANQPATIYGLHLYDLVAWNGSHSSNDDQYRIVVEKWRDQQLVARYYSDPITDNYSNYYIDVDISDSQSTTYTLELVVGLQKTAIESGQIVFKSGSDNFIPPFSDSDWNYKHYPFFYKLNVVSYDGIKTEILRTAQNVGALYGTLSYLTWQTYAWMRTTNINGSLWAKMHLSKLTAGVNYQFVDENTQPDSGKVGVRFGIQEREKIVMNGNVPTNLIVVSPSNDSGQTQGKVNITPSNNEADIYFLASVLDTDSNSQYYINNGFVHNFQIYMQTKSGNNWSSWVDAEWLAIKKGTV